MTAASRNISSAYGVNLWPTMVFIDASGLVTSIRYGRPVRERASPSSGAGAPLSSD